ncbi:MAG: cation diffusion facilitator family transporter [Tepidisphaeraceae bacterium]|jgi:cation diffusion facilitator family transporter
MAITDGTVGQKAYLRRSELHWAWVSLVVGAVLLVIKFAAYFLTGSQAIFSDALENVTNVMTAGFAVYSIRLAHRPADADHPYGHGKIEFFSAGFEGSMVLLASAVIAGKIALSWLSREQLLIQRLDIGLALMSVALLVNGALGLSLWIRGRKNKALTLEAGGIHLMVDALDSVAVLAAIAIVRLTGWRWVDTAGALAVAVYIAILGLRLLKRSAAGLMDEQDPNERRQLQKILDSHLGPAGKEPKICSYHKLRFRHSGRNCWVDFHVMVPKWWNIEQGHRVASAIEHEIELAMGEANATAHVEPCEDAQCAQCGQAGAETVG